MVVDTPLELLPEFSAGVGWRSGGEEQGWGGVGK